MWKYRALLCLYLNASAFISFAQQPPYFLEKLSTREGLGSNKVNDIVQDETGFLWIATSDGLNRFDGTEVVKYYHSQNANSLAHNYVHCLESLPGNWLAIGTQSGLSFFNSTSGVFENFYYHQEQEMDEHDNMVTRLEKDINGNLWAGSRNCIFIFDKDRKLKKVLRSPYTAAEIKKRRFKFVEKIYPLSDGNMLLYLYNGWQICNTADYSITALERSLYKHRLKFLDHSCRKTIMDQSEFFPASNVFKVYDNYFFVIGPCRDSISLYDEHGQQISTASFNYNKYPYLLWSQQLSQLDSGQLMISFHNYGVAVVPVSWDKKMPRLLQPVKAMFETDEYGPAMIDRQGNWWLTTIQEGVHKISPGKQNFVEIALQNQITGEHARYEVNAITRHKNSMLLGTYGDGLFVYDDISKEQKQHDLASLTGNSWSNFIWNIRHVGADTFWIGTQAGLYWYKLSAKKIGRIRATTGKPAALDSVAITTQFVDSRGDIWMGLGRGNGLCRYSPNADKFFWYRGSSPDGFPFRYPIDITEDKTGDLWFVNDGSSALARWDHKRSEFAQISLPADVKKQTGDLHSIAAVEDTELWMGSITGGLIKYDRIKNSFTVYGHDRGLINSHINNIFKTVDKKVWLATEGGLSSFDRRSETFTNYTANDGLPVEYPSSDFYFDPVTQKLYNGGRGSFFYFDPESVTVIQLPQQTVITSVLVNGIPIEQKNSRIKFNSRQNNIAVYYTAIDLSNGPSTRYEYKLMGEDTGWIMAGNQRQINFSHLAPGNYEFRVRASNSNGDWSKESAGIMFSIRPPFTKTAWFYISIILLIGTGFYILYRIRLRQMLQAERIRTEISQNLHDEVGSALTNISLTSLLAQKQVSNEESVNRLLDRIYLDSQQVSQAMREIVWSINPRIDTVGEAMPRMLQYASELLEAKNIEVRADISTEIENVKLAMQERRDLFLIFKEAINNLARHSKASVVIISITLQNDILNMKLSDNGTGFDPSLQYDSNGLKNMRARATHHHWELKINSEPGSGTTLTLKAPIA